MTKSYNTSNEFELPKTYGDTKVSILPKDSIWIFAYWEISPVKFEEFSKQYENDFDFSAFVVRVYDTTGVDFGTGDAHKFFDIYTSYDSLSCYINVGGYNRLVVIEVGFMLKNEKFIPVARSNFLAMPSCGISEVTGELGGIFRFDFEKFLKKNSGSLDITDKNAKNF
jgi:hypothetical protein